MKALVERFAWEYAGDGPEGKPLFISGINIWGKEWLSTNERIRMKDPVYQQEHEYYVNTIKGDSDIDIKFAVCEYSNCYYGFYEYVDRLKTKDRYEKMKGKES